MPKQLPTVSNDDLASELTAQPTGEDMISSSEGNEPQETQQETSSKPSARKGLRAFKKDSAFAEPEVAMNADDYGYESKPEKSDDDEPDDIDMIDAGEETSAETNEKPTDKVDEYGNEITPKEEKMYPESEVNKMIRERLARGNQGQQPTAAQVATATEQVSQTMDADATEADWERELAKVVEKVLHTARDKETREAQLSKQKADELAWQQQESKVQAEFEDSFSSGMQKYGDFKKVVGDKPITDGIMMGIRSMKNPAAFLYAACKNQPQEIERISKITDHNTRMLELGRLDEKIRKSTNATRSNRPLNVQKGDVSDTFDEEPKFDIDRAIEKDARVKINQRLGKGNRR